MLKIFFKILIKKTIVNISYSKFILFNNLNFLIKKIFEEIYELYDSFNIYINKKNCYNKYNLIKEICDVIYHIIIFIYFNNISFNEIKKEFLRRTKISGIKEKFFR